MQMNIRFLNKWVKGWKIQVNGRDHSWNGIPTQIMV